MPDLTAVIEEIFSQQLRDEAQLEALRVQAKSILGSIAIAKEEIAQLLSALEIAIKRGMAKQADLEAIRSRLNREPQLQELPQPSPGEVWQFDGSSADEEYEGEHEEGDENNEYEEHEEHEGQEGEEGQGYEWDADTEEGEDEENEDTGDDEEDEVEKVPTTPVLTPVSRSGSAKLIDLAFDVIQGFPVEREFTTTDIREELEKRYPGMFVANFNPASISGTVARLYTDYDAVVRVGTYTDGIHYRRKVKTEAKKEEGTPMIATTNPS